MTYGRPGRALQDRQNRPKDIHEPQFLDGDRLEAISYGCRTGSECQTGALRGRQERGVPATRSCINADVLLLQKKREPG